MADLKLQAVPAVPFLAQGTYIWIFFKRIPVCFSGFKKTKNKQKTLKVKIFTLPREEIFFF